MTRRHFLDKKSTLCRRFIDALVDNCRHFAWHLGRRFGASPEWKGNRPMHIHWKIVHRELRSLLKEPLLKAAYARLRQARADLHRWPQAQLLASFLARRTPPLEMKDEAARLLLATAANDNDGAEVAGTILVLAGALVVSRIDRRSSAEVRK
jgi:hypothetical protein